jgi:phosphate transport system substrate-binding protein
MKLFLFICFTLSIVCSCSPKSNSNSENKIDSVVIAVDPAFEKLLGVEQYTYEAFNQNKKIHIQHLYEQDALQKLMLDSCKIAVIGRPLSILEKKAFEAKNIFPVVTKIADNAIVLITNRSNEIDSLTIQYFKELLIHGNVLSLKVVFDNKQSTNAFYIKDSLLNGQHFSENVFALHSDLEVIDYVNHHKNAIGIIGLNRISDKDDAQTKKILEKVKLLGLAQQGKRSFKPYQAYIKTREYPFIHGIYMINRQAQQTIGTAFVNFVAGEKGQLIVLKSGMVPAFPPQRIIQVTNN